MSGQYMGDIDDMLDYVKNNTVPGVTFVDVKAGSIASFFVYLDKKGLGWFFYFALSIWQNRALDTAREIASKNDIFLTHHLGPIGFREPGYLWKLELPHVWGPIGGIKVIDMRLLSDKPLKTRIKFYLKNKLNVLQIRYASKVKKALLASDYLLAATISDQFFIEKFHGKKSSHFPENGIFETSFEKHHSDNNQQLVNIIWCGRLTHEKNLVLLIRALSRMASKNWILNVLGEGPLKNEYLKLCSDLMISDKIIWHGQVERQKVLETFSISQIHVITSISEANTTVLFEAMSFGVPTITIDHCGMGDIVNERSGAKIKIDFPEKMAIEMSNVLNHFLSDEAALQVITEGVKNEALLFTWEHRKSLLKKYYFEAVDNWNNVHKKVKD